MQTDIVTLDLLRHPDKAVDPVWAIDMLKRAPYFFLPAALLLKRNPQDVDEAMRARMQQCVALNCPDAVAVTDFIDDGDAGWAGFYPPAPVQMQSTTQAIDDFICTYGQPSTPAEDALIEKLIFNPVPPEYFPDASPDDDLDSFKDLSVGNGQSAHELSGPLPAAQDIPPSDAEIRPQAAAAAHKPAKNENKPKSDPAAHDESLLMESLAKIFIKQRRFERALEIICKLSLNYPEKSVYFADQMRFLQKLIKNQQLSGK